MRCTSVLFVLRRSEATTATIEIASRIRVQTIESLVLRQCASESTVTLTA